MSIFDYYAHNLTAREVPETAPFSDITFKQKEELMRTGLRRYLQQTVREYLSEEEIQKLIAMLERIRNCRGAFSEGLCAKVSGASELRNRYIHAKLLRKDELSILFYNLSPYALLTRRDAAVLAKCAFPNFFASVATINSTFTKYLSASITDSGKKITLAISNISDHSTEYLEWLLISLARND